MNENGFSTLQQVNTPRFAIFSTRVLLLILFLTLFALAFVPWQQTSMGSGKVLAYSPNEREQKIKAPIKGTISKWHVVEGSQVKAGDILVELADNDPHILDRLKQERKATQKVEEAVSISIEAIKTRIKSLKQTRQLAIAAASAHVVMAENKVQAAKQKLKAEEAAYKAAKLNIDRQKKLLEQGLTSKRNVELAEMKYSKEKAAVFTARAHLAQARGELLSKRADRERKGADADAKLAKEEASLQKSYADEAKARANVVKTNVKVSRQERMIIKAPRKGTIARIYVREGGEFIKAGSELALLVPDTSNRAVSILVDGNDVPLIQRGDHVRLQFEGWPAVQFSGWPSIAVGTFGGQVAFVDATAEPDGRFRVIITPGKHKWPKSLYLRQGVRTNAWILLNRVKLGYELWRKLNGFPKTSAKPIAKSKKKNEDVK